MDHTVEIIVCPLLEKLVPSHLKSNTFKFQTHFVQQLCRNS